ncbi:MAG: 50S ribosomal protein L25 [Chitinispirillaceae bacterium]|nr:50S ribosomal protein L25 [Chitinispirillaceae bacterium]
MEIIKLKSRPRSGTGKSYTRKAREQGWVPAIYYGQGMEPVKIEVDKKEFAALVRGKKLTHLIDLGKAGGKETSIAVIRDIQRHVIKDDQFIHVDFHHVAMDKEVTVDCPLVLTGIPIGVKDSGGVLGHPVRTLKIECMPTKIPENITIDVSHLDIGDSIRVRDVSLPDVTIRESEDEVLAVVTHAIREEEVKPVEAEAAVEGEAPAEGGTAPSEAPVEPKDK